MQILTQLSTYFHNKLFFFLITEIEFFNFYVRVKVLWIFKRNETFASRMNPNHLKKNCKCFTETFLHEDCLNLFLSDKINVAKEILGKKHSKRKFY